jgi:peptide/nickel transport system substrate-binding protein
MTTPGWPGAALMANVASVEAVGGRVVEIRFRTPDAEALETLADAGARIVTEEAVAINGDLLRGPTVGSGPWELNASDIEGASYRASPGYYEAGLPYLDGLDIRVIADPGTRVAAVRNKLLDLDQAAFSDVKAAAAAFPDIRVTRVLEPGTGVSVGLNAAVAPLNSPEVRRAVLAAIDPEAIIGAVWDGEGVVSAGLPVPGASWMLPQVEMRSFFGSAADGPGPAGQPPLMGQKLRITAGQFGPRYVETARLMAAALAAHGSDAELVEVTTRDFAEKVWLGGDYQIFAGAQPPVSSLSSYLYSVFHSKGAWNTAKYASAALDQLIDRQAAEHDPEARRLLVLEVQREVMRAGVRFTVVTRVSHWMSWGYVRDFTPNLYRGENFWLAQVWLSSASK